jgi:hypothetical protein
MHACYQVCYDIASICICSCKIITFCFPPTLHNASDVRVACLFCCFGAAAEVGFDCAGYSNLQGTAAVASTTPFARSALSVATCASAMPPRATGERVWYGQEQPAVECIDWSNRQAKAMHSSMEACLKKLAAARNSCRPYQQLPWSSSGYSGLK